jgi:hypothetical protein
VVWTGHGWLTNLLEPEQAVVRAGMFAAMAAMLLVASPSRAPLAARARSSRSPTPPRDASPWRSTGQREGDRPLSRALRRLATRAAGAPVLILAAAFVDAPWREALW